MNPWPARNVLALKIFGPVLIGTGVLSFVLPASAALMSNATPYNVFHIAFGVLGSALAFSGSQRGSAAFNVAFGAVDLWQAVAGLTGLFPATLFALKPADHVLHVVLGAALVAIGALGLRASDAPAAATQRAA